VAKGSPGFLAKAFARAEARLAITRPGAQVSCDEFLREVATEARVILAVRAERHHRKVRRAVMELAGFEELLAALADQAAPGADLAWPGEDLAGELPPEWSGPAGPPAWHPENQ
jgi:hypothetical protein